MKLSKKNHQCCDGFTLIEVLIAIILVGLAIVALLTANTSLTKTNAAGVDLSTAEFLIEQIRELTAVLPVVDPQTGSATFGTEAGESSLSNYDDLDDFDNASFSPPINANRVSLNDFAAFSQQITVENVNANDFSQTASDHSTNFVRVTVKIFQNSKEISSSSWIRANY